MADSGASRIESVDVAQHMQQAYIDYAMSVITARALPDVRDGLLPVQRRILYAMQVVGNTADRPFRKSAKTVGEVIGNYHPHGEMSVYESLVRLAQDFSLRYPLVEGHGNFGSIDGDPPAAMRYTEARLSRLAAELLRDLDKNTVDFVPNYDEQTTEPVVLPARFPHLLVNGATGIAVGMSTNIPPHNLGEVIDAAVALIDDPSLSVEELMRHVRGPDFPTGGLILGQEGIRRAYREGHGTITVRARAEIGMLRGDRPQIVITEIPYQTKKSAIIERIAELYREKRLEGITDVTDASDRHGLRILITLQRGANANVILHRLYRDTPLQQSYGVRLLALVQGRPRTLGLVDLLRYYLEHQRQVVRRRTAFDLERAERRAHIVAGLLVALDHLDEVIELIRRSRTRGEARDGLQARWGMSEAQAEAILDMRLAQLTGLERERLEEEAAALARTIAELRAVLESEARLLGVVRQELLDLRERFADPRRTQIVAEGGDPGGEEELVPEERVVVTLTRAGYCKRTPLDAYRNQGRGGKGVTALTPREEDLVTDVSTGSTHDHLLFFTSAGRVYRVRVYEIPEGSRTARGTAVVNLVPLGAGETITAMIPVARGSLLPAGGAGDDARPDGAGSDEAENGDEGEDDGAAPEPAEEGSADGPFLVMATARGRVKRLRLAQVAHVRRSGMMAIGLEEGDRLIAVHLCPAAAEVLLATRQGRATRFPVAEARVMGRTARGVIGMRLAPGDEVIGMAVVREGAHLFLVSERGLGKCTPLGEFTPHHRGSAGVRAQRLDARTGALVALRVVDPADQLVLITAQGRLIRLPVRDISVQGRDARGVAVMRYKDGDPVVAVAAIAAQDREPESPA